LAGIQDDENLFEVRGVDHGFDRGFLADAEVRLANGGDFSDREAFREISAETAGDHHVARRDIVGAFKITKPA
jgi:hypothetical protein